MAEDSDKQLTWEEEQEAYNKAIDEMFKRDTERRKHLTPDELASEEKYRRYWESIKDATEKYIKAGLGKPMPRYRFSDGPRAAVDYPGGIAAVYEEAVRRGVTWEEVCGYKWPKHPGHGHACID